MESSLWPSTCDSTRRYISGLGKVPADRLRSIWEADVTALTSMRSKILEWVVQPPLLDVGTESAFDACKKLMIHVRRKDPTYEDDVCRRFQYCVLYSIWRSQKASRKAFASELVPLINQADVRVVDISQYWISTGNNLLEIASRLGGYGILLVLPSLVPQSVWESHLRRTSNRFQEAIEELDRKGLRDVAEATGAYHAGEVMAQKLGLPELVSGQFP